MPDHVHVLVEGRTDRAGLVRSVSEYPWIGSSECAVAQLMTAIQLEPGQRRG